MSQATTSNASSSTSSKTTTSKKLLCKAFTEQQISQIIDPNLLIIQLQAAGLQYLPQTPYAMQARAILVEDIKIYIANIFKANNVDIEEDETVATQINTIFESALIKTNPYFAQASGAISKERLQELASVAGFGGYGFGNPMMSGFGGQMGFNPFQQQMGGGFGGQMAGFGAPQMPMWSSKKAEAGKTQQSQQPQGFNQFMNPMMQGGMMPQMGGYGMMNPQMMGMNPGFGMPMGMNPGMMPFSGMTGI